MSEGRTPTATLTQQRRLEQDDVDLLHQIVIRAQNDPASQERPKDALLQAYGEIYEERRLNQQQDRACFDVLLKLLNPATPGESLYHKFENLLQEEGIVLAYDDDATTQDEHVEHDDKHSDNVSDHLYAPPEVTQDPAHSGYYPTETLPDRQSEDTADAEAYPDNTPPYIVQLLRQAEARDRSVLAKQTLDAWRGAVDAAKERQMEARADALYAVRLKRKVLKQCLAVFDDLHHSQMQADQIYYSRLARSALGKTSDEYRVRKVRSMDEDRIKGDTLYKWTVASREATFTRKQEWELKRKFMSKLIESHRASQAKEAHLEMVLQRSNFQQQNTLLQAAMALMTRKVASVKVDEERADFRNKAALGMASINAWRLKMGKVVELNLTAEDAREYFLMKRVLRSLQDVTRFRRDRRTWLATWASHKWQEFVKARKHGRYDDAYRQIRRTIKMNLARKLLLRWQQKVHDNREDNVRADAVYQASLKRRLVRPMVETTYEIADWVQKNEPIADRTAESFLQRRAIIAMQMKQQTLFDMSDRADRFQQYHIEQRAVQGLRQMQLKAFEFQRRQFDADAFRDRHDKRAIRGVLARMRRILAERRVGGEGAFSLMPAPAVTPARKREQLLLNSSTRLSTTPAYTPFAVRLRQEPRVLENIDDEDEGLEDAQNDDVDIGSES